MRVLTILLSIIFSICAYAQAPDLSNFPIKLTKVDLSRHTVYADADDYPVFDYSYLKGFKFNSSANTDTSYTAYKASLNPLMGRDSESYYLLFNGEFYRGLWRDLAVFISKNGANGCHLTTVCSCYIKGKKTPNRTPIVILASVYIPDRGIISFLLYDAHEDAKPTLKSCVVTTEFLEKDLNITFFPGATRNISKSTKNIESFIW